VAEPADGASLRAAILRALAPGWDLRSRAARALAERHPWGRHLDEVEALFVEVAAGG
jgi:hypothetical protein